VLPNDAGIVSTVPARFGSKPKVALHPTWPGT
jgi:hypothetical protein